LNDSKPSDLRSAIEEAFLAENGFNEMLMVEINAAAGNMDCLQSLTRGVFEASDSNQDQECNSLNKASFIRVSIHKLIFLELIFFQRSLDKNAEDSLKCFLLNFNIYVIRSSFLAFHLDLPFTMNGFHLVQGATLLVL
jgi:hypothetical protein